MTFLELALTYAARGWHVHPLKPGDKIPLTKQWPEFASTDTTTIGEWWKRWPNANIGIATGLSKLLVLDADTGINTLDEFIAWRDRNGIPVTYTVRSGRRPEFGVQMYFIGSCQDGKFSLDGVTGDIRSQGGQVVAAGSIHPKSKEHYEVLIEAPPAYAPAIVEEIRARRAPGEKQTWDGPVHDGEGRESFLVSEAGKMRDHGYSEVAILAELSEVNAARCVPPKSQEDVERIARSMMRYPPRLNAPGVKLGTKPPAVQVVAEPVEEVEELERSLAAVPLPAYPLDVFNNTPYMEFAERAHAGNYVPLEFFIECAMTYAGSIAGRRLYGMADEITPRMYTVLIAGPGIGKGSTFRRVRLLFHPARLFTDVKEGQQPGECSALVHSAASENALNDGLLKHSRLIEEFEEIDSFMGKTEITGNSALMGVIRTCFDDTSPRITTSRQRPIAADLAYLSLMGATTPSLWRKMMEGRDSYGSGLGGRFNLVATNETQTTSMLRNLDASDLMERMESRFTALETDSKCIPADNEALDLLDTWWRKSEGQPHYNRVNVIAHRKALHLAWIRDRQVIDGEIMSSALRLADYLVGVRDAFAVVKGEDRNAINENRVLHVLTRVAPKAVRIAQLVDLLDGIMSRTSIQRALDSLINVGEVEKHRGKSTARGGQPYAVYKVLPK